MVLVFDLDGVVCPGPSFGFALEAEHGIALEKLRPFFRDVFPDCVVGRRDLSEVIKPWLTAWGWSRSVAEFLAFWFERERTTEPAVLDCIEELRAAGHRCVLATNQERHRTRFLREEMGLAAMFDEIFASCELGLAKPDEAYFREVGRRLAWAGEKFCLIDDSERNVDAARRVGWEAIHYRAPSDLESARDRARLSAKGRASF